MRDSGKYDKFLVVAGDYTVTDDQTSTTSSLDVHTVQAARGTVKTSNYTKQQILQQISSSVLTQANQAPSIALSLM